MGVEKVDISVQEEEDAVHEPHAALVACLVGLAEGRVADQLQGVDIESVAGPLKARLAEERTVAKEVAAKEAKPGQKRKFEEVFSSTKKDRHQVSGFKSGKVEITEAQLKVLEGVFQTAVIPEPEQIKELCQTTSLPAQEITKWFVKKLNEESKKRLVSKPTGSAGKDSPKGKESKSKVKVIETFKDMTKDDKRALEDIFKANQNPSEEMLSEVSSKLKIDLNLLTKWFSLRGQQKK